MGISNPASVLRRRPRTCGPYAKGLEAAKSSAVGWVCGGFKMTGWKADLDALVLEAMALKKTFVSRHQYRAP